MAYTKQNWQTGDVITADKLNHLEDGIANSKFVVTFENQGTNTYVANCTYEQVRNAYENGNVVEGAYKISAEGEIITCVCTLAEINNGGIVFIGHSLVSDDSIDAY